MAKPVCAVTGASGYVGSRLAAALEADFEVVALGRKAGPAGIAWSLTQSQSIAASLRERGVQALVHVAWDFSHPRPAENWSANVDGSLRLLRDAQQAGVEHLVFISSISAFEGAESAYGKSKLAVEKAFQAAGGTTVRPGLVWGDSPGGMFGSIRAQVSKGGTVPTIGDGRYPQYLVHEEDLCEAVRRVVVSGEFAGQCLTFAHPKVWLLRDLVLNLAQREGKQVKLLEVPWRLIYTGLKTAETLGLKLHFRSDSVLSLVKQNRSPKFDAERPVMLRPYAGS
jgi:nucleoside-diphosphate-sugar epimerase